MTKIQNYKGEYIQETLEEVLDEVVTSITSEYPQATVILFGSYARGDYHKDSDLDFCVLVPEIVGGRRDMNVDIQCTVRDDIDVSMDFLLFTNDEFEKMSKVPSRIHHAIKKEGVFLNGQIRGY